MKQTISGNWAESEGAWLVNTTLGYPLQIKLL